LGKYYKWDEIKKEFNSGGKKVLNAILYLTYRKSEKGKKKKTACP
jgi:hypothetical protein